jgi:Transcriptional regulator/sugar kinase
MTGASMGESIFAIDFSCDAMVASFVLPDGTEEGTAGFDLADFQAGDIKPMDKLTALLTAKARQDNAGGVILSVPADIDKARRTILNFPGASWLSRQPLPEILENALGIPVMMERRSVILLAYDMIMLGLPREALVAGCYIDMHYQNALWYRGAPLLGASGTAGNIAHVTIQGREDDCFCGKQGCVDLYGAGVRLRQIHTMIFPDTPLELLFESHGDHPIIRDYLSTMAYPIAIECNIVDPEYIVLGGLVPSMAGFPQKALEEEILSQRYNPSAESSPVFLPSAIGSTGYLTAAAEYARSHGA